MGSIKRRNLAFTILEVLFAAALISMAIGSILAMNTQALQTLRASRQAAAASQVLQQRIEQIRTKPWTEAASSVAMATLMKTASSSEKELSDMEFVESIRVSVPQTTTSRTISSSSGFFEVKRNRGRPQVLSAGDLTSEPTLLFESSVTWQEGRRKLTRSLRTLICRQGLTRNGIFGSGLGRPVFSTSAAGSTAP